MEGWGERGDGERGAIQIAMQCLTPYAKNFEAMIKAKYGAKKLIHATSLQVWKELVVEVSDDLTRMAIARRQALLRVKPLEKAEAVHARAEERRLKKAFIASQGEKLGFGVGVKAVPKLELEASGKVVPGVELGRIEAPQRSQRYPEQEREWHPGSGTGYRYGPKGHGLGWQSPVYEDEWYGY